MVSPPPNAASATGAEIGAAVSLFLTSAAILFVELLFIRWIPANLAYVGFFNNFLLMASFLGIGVGILLGRRFQRPLDSAFGPLTFALVAVVVVAQVNLTARLPADELFLGQSEREPLQVDFVVLGLVVVLTTAAMASLALPLGRLLRALPPLRAYAIDIIGSLAGIAGFAVLSALALPPLVWFGIAGALVTLLSAAPGLSRWSLLTTGTLAAVLYVVWTIQLQGDLYSPYYRITLGRDSRGAESVSVNGIPHQTMWSASSPDKEPYYEQAFRWFPERRFERVLVVGSGTGTDTAVVLRRGAELVDAVEIDPTILELGVDRHPDRPYADARVTRFVDDGRAYLRNRNDRYDMIIFAQTDSLTLVTTTANIRLESFLFTREAFESVRDHLSPEGVFVLYNYYRERWLIERYAAMLAEIFGAPPLVRSYSAFIGVNSAILAAGPAVAAHGGSPADRVDALDFGAAPTAATDDWPFTYLREPRLVPRYAVALALLLGLAAVSVGGAGRVARLPLGRFSPHFFLLGAAFLLLETRSLVTFSLLFGTTWQVNALVFAAILLSVLAAVAVTARARLVDPRPIHVALFGSLALAYLLPPSALLLEPAWLRYAIASALAFTPVFFANLVFTRSFRDSRAADMAFASNVLGAVVGGILEWLAVLTGYRALLLVVGTLYGLAYLAAERWPTLADRELTRR